MFIEKDEICINLDYIIEEHFTKDVVRFDNSYTIGLYSDNKNNHGLRLKHAVMNQLHNHFEHLQGTVWELSDWYKRADYTTKFAIRQLNLLCHEAESLMLSQRKKVTNPDWVRSSQITAFLNAARIDFPNEYKTTFYFNCYSYME